MQTGYKVGDVMTNKPIIGSKELSLKDAAMLMESTDVNSLLIVENDKAVGIVTDEDVVRKAVSKGLDPKKLKLKDIMVSELISMPPEKDIYDALILMRDNNIRQLPVIKSGKLLGFLTSKDILKIEPELFELVVEKYDIREESRKIYEADDALRYIGSKKSRK